MLRKRKALIAACGAIALTLPLGCRPASEEQTASSGRKAATPPPATGGKDGHGAPDIGDVYVSNAPYRSITFGPTNATSGKAGFVRVGPDVRFDANGMQGWTEEGAEESKLAARDRVRPDPLRRYLLYGKGPRTLRLAALPPGLYRLTVVSGDLNFGDHQTNVSVPGMAPFPLMSPAEGEFATLTATVEVKKGADHFDITFFSPSENWIVNFLTLKPAKAPEAPRVTLQKIGIPGSGAGPSSVQKTPAASPSPAPKASSSVRTATAAPGAAVAATLPVQDDPTAALLKRFRAAVPGTTIAPTGLTRADYLKLITGEVDYWKQRQAPNGAIIDPYRKAEYQYSTPAFAHAAAALVVYAGRNDLLEPASRAMDCAVQSLSQRKAADQHEDFYAPMLAHALRLLQGRANPVRVAKWESQIRRFDPRKTYRDESGRSNWNVVALSGEALFQEMGLRPRTDTFVADSLAQQMHRFVAPYGLYAEGPMAYDHFPRLWAADMLASGYDGPHATELGDALHRAAMTSLFLQSPWGELPAGGRSGQHQWNEAEQCVTFEIYAAQALKAGDTDLAAAYKRAAHLSLASMKRWVRPSGEMAIVKNHVNPASGHGFEGYSSQSQYNLLPTAMLAIAYEHAAPTESVAEKPCPADTGGYALSIERLHKVFASVGGTYVEIDTDGDHRYDATGLIRIHSRGVSPQLGPSDSLVASPAYRVSSAAGEARGVTAAVGVAWQDASTGRWRRLAEIDRDELTDTRVTMVEQTPQRVTFNVTYEGKLFGVSRVVEHYVVTPGRVELSTELPGYTGPLRYVWPVLADDGAKKSDIQVQGTTVTVSQDRGRSAQTFTAEGAKVVRVEPEQYADRNGWARLGVAEFAPGGGKVTLRIAPRPGA